MELPLRDIHLSGPISWWPPAFGWWIIFGAVLLFICLAIFYIRKFTKPTLKKEAIIALNHIEKLLSESQDAAQCVSELSSLLRRISLKISTEHAGLTGNAWLKVLDQRLNEPEFSQGAGKILLHAPYQPYIDIEETRELTKLCRKWVNTL